MKDAVAELIYQAEVASLILQRLEGEEVWATRRALDRATFQAKEQWKRTYQPYPGQERRKFLRYKGGRK